MDAEQQKTDTSTQGQTGTAEEKTLPQSKVNEIVARETGKVSRELAAIQRERDEAAKRADDLAAQLQARDEEKLSAEQRAAKQREREAAKHTADLAAERARADGATQRYHASLIGQAAARRITPLVAQLFNADLADDVTSKAAGRMKVEVDAKGAEQILINVDGDHEPLTDDAWKRFQDAHLTRYLKATGGSGANHGRGVGGGGGANVKGADAYGLAFNKR